MPIKTNMPSLTPRRQAFRREITLLSHGFTNPTAWPDGKLVVYPWDTSVDDYLYEAGRKSNRNDILYGLLARVCDLNGATVDEFVASEVMTVLLSARAMSAGQGAVNYHSTCPSCKHVNVESVTVPDDLEKIGEKAVGYPGYDDITLPDCKDVIRLRPLTVKDEKIILERPTEGRKEVSDRKLRVLMGIVTINDSRADTLAEMVRYYDALSPLDAKFLEENETKLSPHLNTAIPHMCDECSHSYTHSLNFDTEFFR